MKTIDIIKEASAGKLELKNINILARTDKTEAERVESILAQTPRACWACQQPRKRAGTSEHMAGTRPIIHEVQNDDCIVSRKELRD